MRATFDGNRTLKKQSRGRETLIVGDAFWRGVASVFGIAGYSRKHRGDPINGDYEASTADWEALRGDWFMVGRDMRRAVRRFEVEYADDIEAAVQERLFNPDEESRR